MSQNSILDQLTVDFVFIDSQDDKLDFNESDLIEFKPFGLSLTNEVSRPFFILKDVLTSEMTLPVPITPIEAGVTLSQNSTHQPASTPHQFLEAILKSLDIKVERCIFLEIRGVNQYVRLFMSGHPKYSSLKVKASEAISLCLHLKVPFFATKMFLRKSKQMTFATQVKSNKQITVVEGGNGALNSLLSQINPTGYFH